MEFIRRIRPSAWQKEMGYREDGHSVHHSMAGKQLFEDRSTPTPPALRIRFGISHSLKQKCTPDFRAQKGPAHCLCQKTTVCAQLGMRTWKIFFISFMVFASGASLFLSGIYLVRVGETRSEVSPPPLEQAHWVETLLDSYGIPHTRIDAGWLVLAVSERYQDQAGEHQIQLLVVENPFMDGIHIHAPFLFRLETHFQSFAIQALPALQYELKILQLDYDPRDGEVRGQVKLFGVHPKNSLNLHAVFRAIIDDTDTVWDYLKQAAENTPGQPVTQPGIFMEDPI